MIIIGLFYLPMCMQQALYLIVFVFSVNTLTHIHWLNLSTTTKTDSWSAWVDEPLVKRTNSRLNMQENEHKT